jgi:hypothetical protein
MTLLPKRHPLPIRQTPPCPFKRPEAIIAEPYIAEDDLEDPYCTHYIINLNAL